MNTINLKLAIILGSKLEEIRVGIEQFESIHLGLFINSLRYKEENEGNRLKKIFINSAANSIKLINKKIGELDLFIKYLNKDGFTLTTVNKIDLTSIKRIIFSHKGHYPQLKGGVESFIQESLGEGDSPSILARQHTSLQIRNVILSTKLSLSDFVKSINRFLYIFDSIDRKSLHLYIQNEIEKSKTAYSVGLFGESILMLGRLLENLLTDYILLLKKVGKVSLTKDQVSDLDFHQKIEFLHSKKLPFLSDSQFSKLMAIKWDRNTYGHRINSRAKDYQAVITLSLMTIDFFDKKITEIKKNQKK